MDYIRQLFQQRYDLTQREPSFIVDVPHLGEFHVYNLAYQFYLQMALAQCVSSFLNTIFAVVIFHLVVQQRGSNAAYLMGWGLIIPLCWYLPYSFLPYLNIENVGIVFGFLGFPAYIPFRCLEAMYGTTPPVCEASLKSYIYYLASPIPLAFDSKTGKPIPTNVKELKTKALKAFSTLAVSTVVFSILEPTNYAPFPTSPRDSFMGHFRLGFMLNNYLVAYIASIMLESGSLVFQVWISILTGYSTVPFNDSPLVSSSSPSDFWGRRWNQQVQSTLKRGVYKPLRMRRFSVPIATFGTFLASGILHEYTLLIAEVGSHNAGLSYRPKYGFQTLFFLWNFVVVIMDSVVREKGLIPKWVTSLPKPVKTAMVLATVLPISHWFTDEWLYGGFFSGVALAFPRIVWIR